MNLIKTVNRKVWTKGCLFRIGCFLMHEVVEKYIKGLANAVAGVSLGMTTAAPFVKKLPLRLQQCSLLLLMAISPLF